MLALINESVIITEIAWGGFLPIFISSSLVLFFGVLVFPRIRIYKQEKVSIETEEG